MRLFSGLLAVLLVAALAIAPFAAAPQPAAAQSSMADDKMAVVGLDGATLLDAPDGKALAQLAAGEVLAALGRTADKTYLQVKTERGVAGWVTTESVVVFGVDTLKVVEPPKPATPTPTQPPPTPTRQPTPTVQPSPTAQPSPTPAAANDANRDTTATAPASTAAPEAASPPAADAEGVVGVIVGAGAELFAAPDGAPGQRLPGAEAVTVTGRDAEGSWLLVTTLDGDTGWMKNADLVVFGVEELPVMTGEAATGAPAAAASNVMTTTAATVMTTTATSPAAPAVTPAAMTSSNLPATDLPGAVLRGTANVSGSRLNIRSGPAVDYRIVGKAGAGEELAVAARSEDNAWFLIVRDDLPDGAGWVSASLVGLEGESEALPISADVFGNTSAAPVPAVSALPEAAATLAPQRQPAPAATPATAATRTGATGLSGNLAFQDGRGGIYVYDLARGEVRFLTSGFDPAISRDGDKVAFLRPGDGIYSIDLDGANERRVFASSDLITSPKWSPDRNWIVFSRLLGEYQCWNTGFLGCVSLRELSRQFPGVPPALIQRFLLSDSERIALPNYGLARVNVDGKEFRDLAALDSAQAPDWNEDGIVYQSKAGLEVTQDKPDGQTRSVQRGNWDWDPDWAPNGGPIVYQSKEGPRWEVFTVNPDGSGQAALTRPVTTLVDEMPSNVAPAFSPDGKQVVYLSNREENNEAGAWRLWVMNADGSNQRPLPLEMELDYGYGGEQVVSWGE